MTDVADDLPIVTGRREWLRDVNAATVAQAEAHWMHAPGRSPPHVADVVRPLGVALHGEGAFRGACGGERHRRAWKLLDELLVTRDQGLEMRLVRTSSAESRSRAVGPRDAA